MAVNNYRIMFEVEFEAEEREATEAINDLMDGLYDMGAETVNAGHPILFTRGDER